MPNNPWEPFAPSRRRIHVRALVGGEEFYGAVADAMENARTSIFMCFWQMQERVSPVVDLVCVALCVLEHDVVKGIVAPVASSAIRAMSRTDVEFARAAGFIHECPITRIIMAALFLLRTNTPRAGKAETASLDIGV